MSQRDSGSQRDRLVSPVILLVALVAGGVALIIVAAHLSVPIPGTDVMTDPREIFATLGAGLSGPVGGLLIGILAGLATPNAPLASILAHVMGGIWLGFAYKKIVYRPRQTALGLFGWAGLIMAYYYAFLIPAFWAGSVIFYGERMSFLTMYVRVGTGAMQEVILTMFITTLVMIALPKKYRRPIW